MGSAASPLDARLNPLGNYLGRIATMPPRPGSLAIDRGASAAIPTDPAPGQPFTLDQRNLARVSNGTVDIGAFETSARVVVSAADSTNPATLRGQIGNVFDVTTTITFAPALSGQTIFLTPALGQLAPATDIAIDASALANGVIIFGDGASNFRLLNVAGGRTVALRNVNLFNGGGPSFPGIGAAILNSGDLVATRCVLSGSRTGSLFNGGAVVNQLGARATFDTCTFLNNATTGSGAGGGALANAGTLVVVASTFSGNAASANGGAVHNSGLLTLSQCTLAGNSAPGSTGFGGAIYAAAGTLSVIHCTVAANSAFRGGGLHNAGGTTTLTNSLLGANAATSTGADIQNNAALVVAGNNFVQTYAGSSASGSGSLFGGLDPLLAPLDFYGGPTQTMALRPGSLARGNATPIGLTADQRGFPIVGAPDVGAYEAGTLTTNFNAYSWETLPADATVAQHAAAFDFDGDGEGNFDEFLARTDAASSASYLRVTGAVRVGGSLQLTFPTVLGLNYALEYSTNLAGPWNTAANPTPGTGSPVTVSFGPVAGDPQDFVRLRVVP